MYLLIDFLTHSATGVFLTSFIIMLKYIDIKNFIFSIILFFLLSDNYFLVFILCLMYTIEFILSKYVNYNLLFRLSLFTFFYLIINNIDISYFINLILVILIHYYKYNSSGDFLGQRQIFK